MTPELLLQRDLHQDPKGEKGANVDYVRSRFLDRLAGDGLRENPVVDAMIRTADLNKGNLVGVRRWVAFRQDSSIYNDLNVAGHQWRQAYVGDVAAKLDGLTGEQRIILAVANGIHDLHEYKDSDMPRPIKEALEKQKKLEGDPHFVKRGELKSTCQMLDETPILPKQRAILKEVFRRVVVSGLPDEQADEISKLSSSNFPQDTKWKTIADEFEWAEMPGYAVTVAQNFDSVRDLEGLTPEDLYRVFAWYDDLLYQDREPDSFKFSERCISSEHLGKLLMIKIRHIDYLREACEKGLPSAQYFVGELYPLYTSAVNRLGLDNFPDHVAPKFADLKPYAQVPNGSVSRNGKY